MFKKISKAKKFGVYSDFTWKQDQTCDFSKFNLLYGWNYSGKTTLSRIFRCIELQALHNIDDDASFEFEDSEGDSGNFMERSKHRVKVFNTDFVKENLKWETDSNSISPIFILGEESIELRKSLHDKELELTRLEAEVNSEDKHITNEKVAIGALITDKAREVGNHLGIRPFDKRHFLPLIEKIGENARSNLLEHNVFSDYQSKALSTEEKPVIVELRLTPTNLNSIVDKVALILSTRIDSKEKIEKLINDSELSNWFEKGKAFQEGKKDCVFCGNELPDNFFVSLQNHFSTDFEDLKRSIDNYMKELEGAVLSIPNEYNEQYFYSEFREVYKQAKANLDIYINFYNTAVNTLISDLNIKRDKPFDNLVPSAIDTDNSNLTESIYTLQTIVKSNNDKTKHFGEDKKRAIEILKIHHAAEFVIVNSYLDTIGNINTCAEFLEKKVADIQVIKEDISELKGKLSEATKGANKVNTYLGKYFSKDDIRIEVDSSDNYILIRSGKIAKNLSEGEKSAIAFCYFIASLEENGNSLSDTIVYVDDPVSSLDSNHLFNTYSFIKDKFYQFKKVGSTKHHICNCKQFFISTHNFELLNLLKDWFKSMKNTDYSMYLIERLGQESVIKTMPGLIFKHKSEYTYLFSLIYSFREEPRIDHEQLYLLPNVVRRFLESFFAFKFLTTGTIDDSIHLLITDAVSREKVRKFVHYYSHSLSTNRLLLFPDFVECLAIIDAVLKAVEIIDEYHYNALCTSLE